MTITLYQQIPGDNEIQKFFNHPIFNKYHVKPMLLFIEYHNRIVLMDKNKQLYDYLANHEDYVVPFEKRFSFNKNRYIDMSNFENVNPNQYNAKAPLFRLSDDSSSKVMKNQEFLYDLTIDFLHRHKDIKHIDPDNISMMDNIFLQTYSHQEPFSSANMSKVLMDIHDSSLDLEDKIKLTKAYNQLKNFARVMWSNFTALQGFHLDKTAQTTLVQNVNLLEYQLLQNTQTSPDNIFTTEVENLITILETSHEVYRLRKNPEIASHIKPLLSQYKVMDKYPQLTNLFFDKNENSDIFDTAFKDSPEYPYNTIIYLSKDAVINQLEPNQQTTYGQYLCNGLFLDIANCANIYFNHDLITVTRLDKEQSPSEEKDIYQISIYSNKPIDKKEFQLMFKEALLAYKKVGDSDFILKNISPVFQENVLNQNSPEVQSNKYTIKKF